MGSELNASFVEPSIVVAETYAMHSSRFLAFNYLDGKTGKRTLHLGQVISINTVEESSRRWKALYLRSVGDNTQLELDMSYIYDIFPVTPDTEHMVQLCQNHSSLKDLAEVLTKILNGPPEDAVDARFIPAFQIDRVQSLEDLLDKTEWIHAHPNGEIPEDQYDTFKACINAFFQAANARLGQLTPVQVNMIKAIALDVMELAPGVKTQWVAIDKITELNGDLRRQVRDLTNQVNVLENAPPKEVVKEVIKEVEVPAKTPTTFLGKLLWLFYPSSS